MSPINPISVGNMDVGGITDGVAASGTQKGVAGFAETLRTKLDELNVSQVQGDKAAQDMAAGRATDVAQTMLRIEQANVALQLAMSVRNKAIEAYQEVLRMQV